MPLNKSTDSLTRKQFDIDLEFGQQWEQVVDDIFCGVTTAEVKTENGKWQKTGNICIETESFGKPSGIHVTTSDIWVQNLVKDGKLVASIIIPTDVFKEVFSDVSKGEVRGGDLMASKVILLPLTKLFDRLRSVFS